MTKPRLLAPALLILAIPLAAEQLQKNYFSSGWTSVPEGSVSPAPAAHGGPASNEGPVSDLHHPVAHMDITVKAYEVYAAQFGGGELSRYIGGVSGDHPASDTEDNVVAGAYDEDSAYKNPWNDLFPMARHFWERRQGYYKGWNGYDSSLNRAHKYWSGGYGIEGKFDSGWEAKGVKGEGVLGLYGKGDKAKAYWYLGHVAHLVEDLAVPAHAHLFTHIGDGTDAYESYMGRRFKDWTPGPQAPVESFDKLLDLFDKTADITNDFDAGSGPGAKGVDGEKDKGSRRANGFTEAELKEEGAVLMPLAYRRVAALYLFFFKQIDKTPPTVTLAEPISAGSKALLEASAVDELSGVDKRGYRFQYRLAGGWAWRDVAAAPTGSSIVFKGEPGKAYVFRATAVDAAGNAAVSAPKQWRAEAPALARR